MSLTKRAHAIANLGVQTVIHYLTHPFVPREKKGLAKFIKNFESDRLTYITEPELKLLPSFENCFSCLMCDIVCPLYEKLDHSRFPGPSFLPRVAARSMPDMLFAKGYLAYFNECKTCDLCSSVCPQNVNFKDLVNFVSAHSAKQTPR